MLKVVENSLSDGNHLHAVCRLSAIERTRDTIFLQETVTGMAKKLTNLTILKVLFMYYKFI